MKPQFRSTATFRWFGDTLHPNNRTKRPMVRIEQDEKYPGMWRVISPDGSRSDMVNRARAMEAARSILLGLLNVKPDAASAPLQH